MLELMLKLGLGQELEQGLVLGLGHRITARVTTLGDELTVTRHRPIHICISKML